MFSVNTRRFVSWITLFGLALFSACNLPIGESNQIDQNTLYTAAAETIQASSIQFTLDAQGVLLTEQAGTPQFPAQPATATLPQQQNLPNPTQTLAPPFLTLEPTLTFPQPGLPSITANVDTNCRSGPSPLYPRLGYLLKGQTSTVHGRNSATSWWYIANPAKPGQFCWVWGETTVVTGNTAQLVVITPPPPPEVVDYQVAFNNMHDCGVPTLTFWVKNVGTKTLRWSSITIKDLSTNTFISGPETTNYPFLAGPNGCGNGADKLEPNQVAYLLKGLGFTLPKGTNTRAIIVLCTEPDGGGDCLEIKVTFNFP
jgi:hypothetical protein